MILKRGSTGPGVVRLQEKLNDLGFDAGKVDGVFGAATKSALKEFQNSKGMAGDGIAGPDTLSVLDIATTEGEDEESEFSIDAVTPELVSQIFPGTPRDNIQTHLPFVLQALKDADLADKEMVLLTLGIIRAETGRFEPISESVSRFNTSPEGHPFDLYDDRKALGNQGRPDGENFRGRGFIQITGRANYQKFGDLIGLGEEMISNPDLANKPDIAAKLLVAFIKDRENQIRQALADHDLSKARRLVNGGNHGLEEFTEIFKKGEKLLLTVTPDDAGAKAPLTPKTRKKRVKKEAEVEVVAGDAETSTAGISGSEDRDATSDVPEPPPTSPHVLGPEIFGRLSPSSRRALSHAAGMRRRLTVLLGSEIGQKMTLSETEIEKLALTPQPIPLAYLVAGLFENDEGPTRRLFLSKKLDVGRLANKIEEAEKIPLPSRINYSPIKLDKLPELTPEADRALQAARDIADKMGATQIQSRHLLYGALSIKDSKLVLLLAEAGVRQEDVPLTDAAADAPASVHTIARLNSDNAEGEDLLGIDGDVNALASVIAARDVATPLSIGLFGDWGSGKSFFMGKLRSRIFELRDMARAADGKSAYCDNVVQIEFNAWSYQEGDLWASLVTDIFESLAQSIDEDAGLSRETEQATAKARLLASMASAGDVLAEQERKRDAAEQELRAGEQQFEALKKIGSKDIVREAYRVAAAEPEVRKGLDAAADQLNIPEAQRALGDLKVELLEIKHLWSAIPLAFKGWNRPRDWFIALAVMAAVVLMAWVAAPLVLHFKLDSATGSIVAFLSLALGRLAPVIKKAKDVTATIKGIRDSQQQRIEEQQEQMKKKLDDAQLRVQHAKENLQRLEQSLQEMRADTQLLNFVRQRRLSTDYTSRLGTVARARRDFRQLSDLMDQARLEHLAQTTPDDKKAVTLALPRIDRIVLYIDDLDRCSEDKVVKVLEAVHLLLAFKLFVVIVAVDSRWLLHSLRQHSAAFRTSNKGAGISDEEDAHWESTPLNYLEKIFQIPFYLRPMRARGFDRLVHTVIGEVLSESAADAHLEKPSEKVDGVPAIQRAPERQPQQVTQAGVDDKAQVAPDATLEPAPIAEVASAVSLEGNETSNAIAKGGSSDKVDAEIHGADIQTQPEAPTVKKEREPAGSSAEANPAALQLREWERDFMTKLHPLIMSPRSAKRFINIYRLMRVSITNERDLEAFVGNQHGGQHRAALLLLAILTGYPGEATDILRDLLEEERPETWWQYIDGIEAKWISPNRASSGSGLLSTQRRRDLMDKLRLLRGEIPETQSCDQFVKWASKVARYSFESGRVLALTNDETETD